MPRNTCCIHLNKLKRVKIYKDENLTVDVFRPRIGFAVNPFAPSCKHVPPVLVERPGTAKGLLPFSVSHTKAPRKAMAC